MSINLNRNLIETRKILKGIYPILNVGPDTEIDNVLEWATRLPEAGIQVVQVRVKNIGQNALAGLLDELVNHLKGSGLTVILNDYLELVGITGADGLHLGLDDYPVFGASAILGSNAIVGVTVRNHAEALLAVGQGASYVAAGSIFESPTKPSAPVMGLDGLKDVVEHIDQEARPREGWGRFNHTPVCAIGGITGSNLKDIYEAGASMAAVISAIQDADDPLKTAGELVEVWSKLDSIN